jgi:hypothetical protein
VNCINLILDSYVGKLNISQWKPAPIHLRLYNPARRVAVSIHILTSSNGSM